MPNAGRNPIGTLPLVGQGASNYIYWYPDEFPLTAREGEILCFVLCWHSPLLPYDPLDGHGITIEKCPDQDAYTRTGYLKCDAELCSSKDTPKTTIKLI